ncbi:glycosyltransferase [Azospirillum sp. ST 5-10]|uniref:glycosyltransferase n=1 Tax=unclassified Azospirillum TaxID=2630922 RepID=UPI003F4A6961
MNAHNPPAPASRRAAFFLHGFEMGGAQRRSLALAGELVRRGWRIDLLVALDEGPLRPEVPAGVRVVDLGGRLARLPWVRGRRRRRVRAVVPALAAYLRAERPAVLMAAANHTALAAAAAHALARCPEVRLVLRASNSVSATRRSLSDRLKRLAVRWTYPRAAAVAAVSQAIAAELTALQPRLAGRVHVVPNPVIGRDAAQRMTEPADHPWFAPGEPPVVLGVGRLAPQKDFATLVRAVARLRGERPARLLILGDGEEREALTRLAGRLGFGDAFALPGFVANPLPYMGAAAAFVLSSRWEGMPGVLIEAMACGCPVVSTDCPGGSAEVLGGGALGPLVPVGDDAALAAAIRTVLDAGADRPALRARAADFSVDRAGAALDALFTAVIADRAPS